MRRGRRPRRARALPLAAAACAALAAPPPSGAQADGPSIEVEVSHRTVALDESLRVTVHVRGEGADAARVDARPPEGERLLPLGSWSTSTQMSWVNGRFRASKSFTAEYVPSGLGRGRVPPVAVRLADRVVETEPVAVEIVEGERGPPGGEGGAAAAPRRGAEGGRDEVEVVPRVSRRKLYAGESLRLEYVLRTRVSVSGVDPESLDPVPGFVVDDLEVHPRATEKEVRDEQGRVWREYVLFRRELTPTRTGTVEIPPVPFRVAVPPTRNDLMSFAFRSSVRRLTRVARGVPIDVRPLPDEGRPDTFSGAVGTFELDARLAKGAATAGEAVDLEVSVTGSGPLDAVSPPEIVAPGDVQVFTPRERRQGARTTWVYPVVPRAAGTVRLEAVRFAYFDTGAEEYRELTAGPFTLEVAPSAPGAEAARVAPGGPVRAQASDLAFIHAAPRRVVSREGRPGAARLAAIFGAPLVLLPIAVGLGRLRARVASSQAGRRRRAAARVRAAYRDAERRAERDADAALRSLTTGLHAWLDGVIGEPSRPLDRARVRRLLTERTGDEALARRAVALLDRAEAARYAGRATGADVVAIVREARALSEEP